jgi:hypothetical protein
LEPKTEPGKNPNIKHWVPEVNMMAKVWAFPTCEMEEITEHFLIFWKKWSPMNLRLLFTF